MALCLSPAGSPAEERTRQRGLQVGVDPEVQPSTSTTETTGTQQPLVPPGGTSLSWKLYRVTFPDYRQSPESFHFPVYDSSAKQSNLVSPVLETVYRAMPEYSSFTPNRLKMPSCYITRVMGFKLGY